eukprot:309598_1
MATKSARRAQLYANVQKNQGNLEAVIKDDELSQKKITGNFLIYDDDKEERFAAVVQFCEKYNNLADKIKNEINEQLKKKEKKEERKEEKEMEIDSNNNNKNENNSNEDLDLIVIANKEKEKANKEKEKAQNGGILFEDCTISEAIYLLMQVAASRKQTDKKLFRLNVLTTFDSILQNLIYISDQISASLLQETHLITTYHKIILSYKEKPFMTEKHIGSAFDIAPVINVNENAVDRNFVEANNYSLSAKIREMCEEKECMEILEFVKLCVDSMVKDMFCAIKWILLVLQDSLKTLKKEMIDTFSTRQSKEDYIKYMLRGDWCEEKWILTKPFEAEGAPKELAKNSIEVLHGAFMNYMQQQIDEKLT